MCQDILMSPSVGSEASTTSGIGFFRGSFSEELYIAFEIVEKNGNHGARRDTAKTEHKISKADFIRMGAF